MTEKRERIVPADTDEAVIKKLMVSFEAEMKECSATCDEVLHAAARLLILGLKSGLCYGDPSTATPEIEARLVRFGKELREMILAVERDTMQ
jgi:hypothetical protein